MSTYKKSVNNKKAAKKIIQKRMLYAAGLGFIPVPIIDAVGILSNQILMTRELADLYDIPFSDEHKIKSFISSMVGTLGTVGVVKAIPIVGSFSGGLAVSMTGTAATYAVGKVFVQHFNMGGTLLDFDPVKSRQYFQEEFQEGKRKAEKLRKRKANKLNKFITGISTSNEENGVSHVSNDILSAREAIARKKAIRLRRHRTLERARRRKVLKRWGIFFLVITILALAVYVVRNIRNMNKADADTTEIDLYMAEVQARKIALKPATDLDSITIATIAAFSPISTEGVIAKYIQDPEATYPKRYALSAVRFIGSSEKLSTGATQQLANIAFLMKKYPDLILNLYGHTTNVGPKFNRQRVGRERARVLTTVFTDHGIESYRITGNHIEKSDGTHNEYWGAEIVVDVSTVESAVTIKEPKIPTKLKDIIPPKVETPKPVEPVEEEQIPDTLTNQDTIEVIEDSSDKEPVGLESDFLIPFDPDSAIFYTQQRIYAFLQDPNSVYPKIYLLSHAFFRGESTELTNRGKAQIMTIAQIMEQLPTVKIEVMIHAPQIPATMVDANEIQSFESKWDSINTERAQGIRQIFNENGTGDGRLLTNLIQVNKNPQDQNWNIEIKILSK